LWTDSRYWNEATNILDSSVWTLQKQGAPGTKTITKYLSDMAVQHYESSQSSLKVGMDPFVQAASMAKELQDSFQEAAEKELGMDADDSTPIGVLETSNENLIDPIWGSDRPEIPFNPFRVHPIEYAGITVAEKIVKIRKEMKAKKATLAVFCTLDDVAYLLNVRCTGDVDTCPIGIAYATVSMEEVTLYCDDRKVKDPVVQEHLKDVTMKPYDGVVADIAAHCDTKGHKVWLDKSRAIFALSSVIPDKCLVDAQNAVTPMKAVKNAAELAGMRQAHIVDGVAMAKFVSWLEHTVVTEGRTVSEVEIDEKLTGLRAEQFGFTERSFPTIAGVGPNGAIIHYSAAVDSGLMRFMDTANPILIDSGGQYAYGTTDVTRNWHFGTPTAEYVDSYTRVLKGHIGLDVMIFPENTPGFALDIYARRWLWDAGKDYGHGTGHGVGAALNVHEGPQGISPRWTNKEVMKAGMVISNEPGYYEDGKYGIRIENLMEVQYVKAEDNVEKPEDDDAPNSTEKKFLKFKKLTMIPMQKNLVDLELMADTELDWLDAYHEQVLANISPLVKDDSRALAWLTKSCEKIDRKGR
jgi:Xaa-Pro aminopeptidase